MDLDLRINGDSSGAQEAFAEAGAGAGQLGEDVGKSVVKWQALLDVASAAAKAVVKFGVDAVKAYADSERVQLQLVRASGEYASALDGQAKALSKLYAVDDDVIKQSQVLLTQWGGVGAATDDVEKATLNLAAAMGGDLNSATQELIRNVESGGTGLAKMGIHFKETGDKGKDLAAAVAAINAKLGGAATADADSLTGRTRAANIAFEDLKKSFGGFITTIIDRSGVLEGVTGAMRDIALGAEKVTEAFGRLPGFLVEVAKGKGFATAALMKEANSVIANALAGPEQTPGIGTVTGETNKGMKEEEAAAKAHASSMKEIEKKNLEDWKSYLAGMDTLDEAERARDEKDYADELALSGKRVADDIKEADARTKIRRDMLLQIEKDNAEHAEKVAKEAARIEEKSQKESLERAHQQEKQAREVGDQVGAALVNALADQLSKLAQGGEFDVALFVGDILAAAVGTAATVIGTAYGAPAVGAAVGNLAAMGIRAGAGAISAENKKKSPKTYHSGGWVGDEAELPRYHSGTWIGPDEQAAVLQTGERVLSRLEVHHMGGQGGVDSMAKGRGGGAVYIQAIDAKSMADTFVGSGGDGLKQALRRGQGSLPSVFGRSPR